MLYSSYTLTFGWFLVRTGSDNHPLSSAPQCPVPDTPSLPCAPPNAQKRLQPLPATARRSQPTQSTLVMGSVWDFPTSSIIIIDIPSTGMSLFCWGSFSETMLPQWIFLYPIRHSINHRIHYTAKYAYSPLHQNMHETTGESASFVTN